MSELIGHIANNLHLCRDLAALSIASKAAKKELDGSLNVLKRLNSLILLPVENRLPEFKTHLETQATNPGVGLLYFANAISHLRPNNQLNAIKTILDKTNDSSVLTVLASQVGHLPTAESTAVLHAILDKTVNVGVLSALATEIGYLPDAEKTAGLRAILDKTDDLTVRRELEQLSR
ncbi:MAG: hypothetical protein V4695_05750 [Pseudomonadota bacterium]